MTLARATFALMRTAGPVPSSAPGRLWKASLAGEDGYRSWSREVLPLLTPLHPISGPILRGEPVTPGLTPVTHKGPCPGP